MTPRKIFQKVVWPGSREPSQLQIHLAIYALSERLLVDNVVTVNLQMFHDAAADMSEIKPHVTMCLFDIFTSCIRPRVIESQPITVD